MKIDLYKVGEYIYNTITFEMLIKFVILYFFIVWFALLLWVIRDISNRTSSILLQVLSILIVLLFTPLGIFIYLIIRPGKTLFEKYYEDIEDNLELFQQIIDEKNQQSELETHCFSCQEAISPDFIFCPKCKTNLKMQCSRCNKMIQSNWDICPYCGTEKNINDLLESHRKYRLNVNKEVKKILGKPSE
ncbi:MAG: zinc ribbon domain-containing protein [Candidatus Gracilibacteria bacterium]|nr:zinc ribbon domain-containing protein [Candidatus Gracilibacteria bacterium]